MMLFIILSLGLVLRLISLNQSLWLDEATTAIVSSISISDFFNKFMLADFHPPLYYLVVKLWVNIFGSSEISLRIPSIIFGLLTIYLTFLISKSIKLKNPYLAPLLLATSGLHVYYSQEARMYAMATFLVSLIVHLFLTQRWFFISIALSLLFLTDYLSILILVPLFVYTFVYYKERIKPLIYSLVPLGLTFMLWFPTFITQLSNGLSVKESSSGWWSVLGTVNLKNIILIPLKFIIGRISIENDIFYTAIAFTLFALFTYIILKAKNKFIWMWFLLSLISGIIISFFIPTLTYFRYLFVLPAFYILLSENISTKLFLLVLAINILTTATYLISTRFHREDWRQIAVEVRDQKIVFPQMSQTEALDFYGKGNQIILKESLDGDIQEFWLSRYVWNVFDPNDETRKYIEGLGYNMVQELNLNGVVFWKYNYENRN